MDKNKKNYILINDLSTYQNYLKAILLFFDEFCRKNDILYSLTSGTLLGAIRHNDIIPWDDDLDVMMTRENMQKLAKAFEKYDGRYFLQYLPNKTYHRNGRKDYYEVHWRLVDKKCSTIRYNLDIFSIDYLDSSTPSSTRNKICKNYNKLWKFAILFFSFHLPTIEKGQRFGKLALNLLIHFLHPFFFIWSWLFSPLYKKTYLEYDRKIQGLQGDKGFVSIAPYVCKKFFINDWMVDDYQNYIDVQIGNFKCLSVPNYDSLLTDLYGDYMTPPNINERCGHIKHIKCRIELDDELNALMSRV